MYPKLKHQAGCFVLVERKLLFFPPLDYWSMSLMKFIYLSLKQGITWKATVKYWSSQCCRDAFKIIRGRRPCEEINTNGKWRKERFLPPHHRSSIMSCCVDALVLNMLLTTELQHRGFLSVQDMENCIIVGKYTSVFSLMQKHYFNSNKVWVCLEKILVMRWWVHLPMQ